MSLSATAAERLVTIKPVKGVEIGIPKGWKACDATTDARLGKADDPMKLLGQVCTEPQKNPDFKFGTFSPKVLRTASIYVLHLQTSPIDSETVKNLTPELIAAIEKEQCAERKASGVVPGFTLDGCSVRVDKLDKKPALVTTTIQTPEGNAIGQVVTEIWEVPYANGLAQFNFNWAKVVEKTMLPELKRIKDSIDLD